MKLAEISPTEKRPAEALAALEKKYRKSKQKALFLLLIPLLWILGAIPAYFIGSAVAWECLAGWCIGVTFCVGVYATMWLPDTAEVVHNYAQLVLPELFRNAGVNDVRVHTRHDLSMKTFLDSGLYHDRYNSISREDSIQGNLHGVPFGMYEVAMQVGGTRMNARSGIVSGTRTNYFYGWFVMLNVPRISGFHFITMRGRKNSGESDDWLQHTIAHWENDVQLQQTQSGNAAFDRQFMLNSDQPFVL